MGGTLASLQGVGYPSGGGGKGLGAKNSPVLGGGGKAHPQGWGQQLGFPSFGDVLETCTGQLDQSSHNQSNLVHI